MDLKNYSTPGFLDLPEFTQTHVLWVGDSIQPSYPQLSAFPPALNFSQHQDLFTSESYRGWVLFEDTTCVHAQSCPVLCDPMVFSPPCFSVHEILLERILEWVIISSSRESSWLKDWTCVFCSFCIGRWILYHWVTWEALKTLHITPVDIASWTCTNYFVEYGKHWLKNLFFIAFHLGWKRILSVSSLLYAVYDTMVCMANFTTIFGTWTEKSLTS